MNISQEKIDNLNTVVKINIHPEDYQPRVEKAMKDQAKKAKLPGFRPGMVPVGHIKKMYGKSILVDEINNMLSDTLNKYLDEEKLEVLGQPLPKVDDSKEYNWDFADNFEFNYEVGLAPQFDIDFSSKDKLQHYVIKVDDETLASRIKNIRRSYGKMTNPDVSADDDVLYSELTQLSPDGSVFEGGVSNIASVRLDQIKDEKIKKSLLGLKKGDELVFDINAAFDNDAAKVAGLLKIEEDEAADLKSNFKLTVKNVNRLEEGDLNQEFFDKIFGEGVVTDEAGFKAKITEELEMMMTQDADRKLQDEIYSYSVGKVDFELPDAFLKRWLKATNEKLTEEELEGGYNDFAKNLKWTLIENKLMKENNIDIKYEEVFEFAKGSLDQQFRMYSPQALTEEQLGQYTVQYLQNKENANKVFEQVKALKVFDYIKSVITLDNKEILFSDFNKLTA
ncbi:MULTISPECIES: trigger factor [unclassified Mucilaginibacter]|uniref:trigger factor n=1 Tax=unclassified Mucilaginibacter TaxID=2617802 RepID=UPI002AC95060|nr:MULTISPECIES: trigger factor [unclassified Mucilaginibacter]MEB0261543.1 trigger factor [Mucilaginibacter sp. 10I4]MEB0277820.1 trigger factor [Mucilaginibacter sp. 10B2]MEB0302419.1 trigger factor [Mucilaginibacter sp. 5C4]WPX22713.1 trigger factor [Mucilaginibacter sp. 5C4]